MKRVVWLTLAGLSLGYLDAPALAQNQPTDPVASVCPDNFWAFRNSTETLICFCDSAAAGRGSVWGMDIYTSHSFICRAAVHAGAIPRQGGQVAVVPAPGREAYPGVTRNGVISSNFGRYASSFRFAFDRPAAIGAPARPASAPADTVSVCPDNFEAFRNTTATLTCVCDAAAAGRGSVWGMDIYTTSSSVCRAALHAGAIPRQGGQVDVVPVPGREAYPGVTRNGVISLNLGRYATSFRFASVRPAAAPPVASAAPVQQDVATGLRERGQVDLYVQFRFNSAELEPSAAETLNALILVLTGDRSMRLKLIGHTDSIGSASYNRALSLRRAQSVRDWLVAQGVPAGRLAVEGRGFDEPIADNETEFGRATNRRVQALRM